MNDNTAQGLDKDEQKRVKWSAFVETDVADFFQRYELEKLSLEDGNGNKAKLSRTKDDEIKVEHSSTIIL
jgi:hypothetical protein